MLASCSGYKDDLSSLLDDQLEEARKADVSAHLTDCQSCRQDFEGLRSLSKFLGGALKSESMPVPDIWSALSGKLPGVCEVMEEDLSAYLDGELGANAQEGVAQHLKDCEPCRDRFKALNATNQLLSKGLELPASVKVDLWASVKSRINEDCALIESELSAYVDQEVPTLRHRAITAHLLECPSCHGLFGQLSSVGDVIRASYVPDIPEDFDIWPEVKAKLQVVPFTVKAKPRPKLVSHKLYLVGAAAVVVGVLGSLAFFLFGPVQPNVRPVSAEAYLLESALTEPGESAEEVVYENQ